MPLSLCFSQNSGASPVGLFGAPCGLVAPRKLPESSMKAISPLLSQSHRVTYRHALCHSFKGQQAWQVGREFPLGSAGY